MYRNVAVLIHIATEADVIPVLHLREWYNSKIVLPTIYIERQQRFRHQDVRIHML
jgi:hypothetical protein